MYPIIRLRRNRKASWLRSIVAETVLSPSNLVLPIFLTDEVENQCEIKSMPGVFRHSPDQALKLAQEAEKLGIKAVSLFPCVSTDLKSDNAEEAYNLDNVICRTIRIFKNAGLGIGIIADVALDTYTTHGHDGIMKDHDIDNDKTLEALTYQALTLAKAGVDVVAPSDMMDGRILAIRNALDEEGFSNINILSYAAKYCSSFYGPFRDAVSSNQNQYLSKATYQMDIRNAKEALKEIEHDINEGADMIMIKPGIIYLDILKEASSTFNSVFCSYQVSGEYSMLKFASLAGAINWEKSLIESLIAFKRAGASAIFTYAAIDAANILNESL